MPVASHAAVIPGKYYGVGMICIVTHWLFQSETMTDNVTYTAYTECINLLDYSAFVIPVTTADKSIDHFDHKYKPLNDIDRKNWEACESLSILFPVHGISLQLMHIRRSRDIRRCTSRSPDCCSQTRRRKSVGTGENCGWFIESIPKRRV